jgi:signal peptidase
VRKHAATIGLVALACMVVMTLVPFVFGPYRPYVIHTGSMGNTIPSRSLVIVHEGEYHIGQAVTFTVNGATVTHRLIKIDEDGNITTKGDANRSVDPWHPPKSNIIGGVVSAPQYLGWWLYFLFRSTGGLCAVLFILAIWQCWTLPKVFEPQEPSAAVPATV